MNGLTDDMKRFLLAQTLLGAAQPMLAASGPSTDPRNKSLGYALGQGIGGMQQGQQQGMAGIMARMQMEDAMKRRTAREQVAGQIGQPPQQGIASMMGGGTMLDSGQVIPQGQTMMGNRVVPQGLADIMKAGIGSGELGMADVMKLYTQEPKKFGAASAGAAIYDETTGEVKSSVPAASKINTTQYVYQDNNGNYRIGLFDEEGNLQKDLGVAPEKMVKNASTSQTVNIKQETEEAKAIGKGLGEKFIKAGEDADNAVSQLDSLDRVESLLQGVETGRLTPLGTEIAGYAKSLGINIDPKSGNKEAAQSLVNQFVLQLRNPASGAGMPGQLSDSDRKFLQSMGPGIEKTPEGRRQIIETMRKVASRRIEYAEQMQEYRDKNNTLSGFDAKWRTYVNKNPLFKDIKIVPTPEQAIEELKRRGTK